MATYGLGVNTNVQPKGLYPDMLPSPELPTQTTQPSMEELFRQGNVQVSGPRPSEEEALGQLLPSPPVYPSEEEGRIRREGFWEDMLGGFAEGKVGPEVAAMGERQLSKIAETREAERTRKSQENAPMRAAMANLEARRKGLDVFKTEKQIEAELMQAGVANEVRLRLNADLEKMRRGPISGSGILALYNREQLEGDPSVRKHLLASLGFQDMIAKGQGLAAIVSALTNLKSSLPGVLGKDNVDVANSFVTLTALMLSEMTGRSMKDFYDVHVNKSGRSVYTLSVGSMLGGATPTAQQGGGFDFGGGGGMNEAPMYPG